MELKVIKFYKQDSYTNVVPEVAPGLWMNNQQFI